MSVGLPVHPLVAAFDDFAGHADHKRQIILAKCGWFAACYDFSGLVRVPVGEDMGWSQKIYVTDGSAGELTLIATGAQ